MDDLFNKALAQAGISDLAGQNAQSGRIAQNIQKDHPAIPSDPSEIFKDVGVTEYVGTAIGPTIGLILPGMQEGYNKIPWVHQEWKDKMYKDAMDQMKEKSEDSE